MPNYEPNKAFLPEAASQVFVKAMEKVRELPPEVLLQLTHLPLESARDLPQDGFPSLHTPLLLE